MELMTPTDVARVLGVSEAALAQLRYKGTGPAYIKLNSRTVRYESAAIEAWLASRTVGGGGRA